MPGVTVAVCCHNGARRLPDALARLAAQRAPAGLVWEVLLVDNASTDDTAAAARRCWPADAPAPLRVVREPRLGLSHARRRAFEEARYEVVSFVDDDNWVAPNWVEVASRAIAANPDVGAFGSINEPASDGPLPKWFDRFAARYYAIMRPHECAELPRPLVCLAGTGLTVRKDAWRRLAEGGFRHWRSGQSGRRDSFGEDIELTVALYLAGWRLEIEPQLTLKHYLSAERLTWPYVRRIARAYASCSVALSPYFDYVEQPNHPPARAALVKPWLRHALGWAKALALNPRTVSAWLFSSREGDVSVASADWMVGRMLGFITLRGELQEIERSLERARWRAHRGNGDVRR